MPKSDISEKNQTTINTAKPIVSAVRFLLLPWIIIVSYYAFGFQGFCLAALIVWACGRFLDIAVLKKTYSPPELLLTPIWPLLVSWAWHSNTEFFAQIAPTICSASMLFLGLAGLIFRKPRWSNFTTVDLPRHHATLILVGVGLTFIIANEYIRSNFPFETWVWYISFWPFIFFTCSVTVVFAVTASWHLIRVAYSLIPKR